MRIGRHQLFIEVARVFSKRSTCFRLNVGAVITNDKHRPISCGYNGAPSGQPHCEGNDCPYYNGGKCTGAIHAEVNALSSVPPSIDGPFKLYVTHSPCPECAALIVEDGRIQEVYFEAPYRIEAPIIGLITMDIAVYKVSPSGYVIDQRTKEIIPDA